MTRELIRAERLVAGGDALAHLADGRVAFVPGALPGEAVMIDLTDERRDFARGCLVEVVEASDDRVDPRCPAVAMGCGGCDWQHLSAAAQQHWKMEIVREAMRRGARGVDADLRWGGAVSPWGYRSTLRVAAGADGRFGLRASRSDRVVPLDTCPVSDGSLQDVVRSLRYGQVRGAHPRPRARHERSRRDERDEVTVRVSQGRATVAAPDAVLRRLTTVPQGVAVGDSASLDVDVAGRLLRVSGASFFQSGPGAAELLVSTVGELVERTAAGRQRSGVLLDAYGGVGLFAAMLHWPMSVVVESSPMACADARASLGDAAHVVCSSFESWDPSEWADRIDVAVVDPARAGLGAAGVAALDAVDPGVVVLVSCDPVSMARDVAGLVERGFVHRDAVVLDLFPQTHHVEVVTLLERTSTTSAEA